MPNPFVVDITGDEGLLSYFAGDDAKYVVVMNKSLTSAHDYNLKLPVDVVGKMVVMLEAGSAKSEVSGGTDLVKLNLAAGSMVVFRLEKI
jgi:hypothetical protein